MADALCGPSNPLQQFKQQTNFDRTLQQDRLTSRQSPAQGFRSADPNAGLLDPEFEAFQAGLPPSGLSHHHPTPQLPPSLTGPSQAPAWATDFQRMQISPSPTSFHQQQQYVPQAGPATPNWAQGFQQHIAQTAPRAQTSAQSPQAFQYMARYGTNSFQNNFAPQNFPTAVQSKGKDAVTEQFDEAAFARAFDQAKADMMAVPDEMEMDEMAYERGASTGNYEEHVDQVLREAMSKEAEAGLHHMEHFSSPEDLQRLEAEPAIYDHHIPDVEAVDTNNEEVNDTKQQEDGDALALTAQELLEKVEHNKTDKFRNSQFLSLMRRLRDREVKVEGDKMVETGSNAAASASAPAPTLIQSLSNPGVQLRFDNSEQTPQAVIPPHEQDLDAGRFESRDGQAVVDLLNRPHVDASPDDIGTSAATAAAAPSAFPEGVFYGDLRDRTGPQ